MKNKKYIYIETKTKQQFRSYTDIAAEYDVGKGVVAGRFYRATKKGTSAIKLKNSTIKRVEYVPTRRFYL